MQSSEANNPSTDDLIRLALSVDEGDFAPSLDDGDDEGNDPRWDAVAALQHRGTCEVFEAAQRLCKSANPKERALGADILAQGRSAVKTFHAEAVPVLLRLLEREDHPAVLYSATMALGHRDDPSAIGPLVRLKDHPDPNVRYGVVFGLLGHEDDLALRTLIELSADEDTQVRDWATFGLGNQVEADTPEIREALVRRLADPDPDTQGEAMVGLAVRGDARVVEPLIKVLEAGWTGRLVQEAVETLEDPRVTATLARLKDNWDDEDRSWAEDLLHRREWRSE